MDEAIRDQFIQRCRDPELRREFLEKAQDGTPSVLPDVAQVHDSVKLQMQSLETSRKDDQVNAVRPVYTKWRKKKKKKKRNPEKKYFKPRGQQKSYRCNETGHFARNCPPLNKTCGKCGFTGYLAVCCKTKNRKRPPSGRPNPNGTYQVEEQLDQIDGYSFAVKDGNKTIQGIVHVQVRGVELKDVLIDSGAACNIVDKITWERLTQKGVKCYLRNAVRSYSPMVKLNQLKYWEHLKLKFTVKFLPKAVWVSSLLLRVLEKLCLENTQQRK